MNEVVVTPKPKFNKVLKWTGIILLSLFVLLLLLLVAVYFVLQQGSLTNTAMSKINPVANAFGVNISRLDSAKIDLLGLIDINGVAVEWNDAAAGKASLSANQIRLRYSLSDLLDGKLLVNEVRLSGINLDATLQATTAEPPPLVEESAPLDLNSLGVLLSQPPLPIEIQAINVEDIRFAVTMVNADSSQAINGSLEKFSTALNWNQQQLKLSALVALNQTAKNAWRVELIEPQKQTSIDLLPVWKTDIVLELNNSNNLWQLPQFSIAQDIALQQLTVQENAGGKTVTAIGTDEIRVTLKSEKLQSTSSNQSGTGLAAIFPVQLATDLNYQLSLLKVNVDQAPELKLATQMQQAMNLQLRNTIQSLAPLVVDTEYSLDQNLEIPQLALNVPDQAVTLADNKLRMAAKGKSNLDQAQTISLDSDISVQLSSNSVEFDQISKQADAHTTIKAGMKPSVNLQGKISLPNVNDILSAVANLNASVVVQLLEASITTTGVKETYALKEQSLNLAVNYQNKQVQMQSTLALDKLTVPQLQKTVSVQNELSLATDVNLTQAELLLSLDLDKQELVNAKLNVGNHPKQLTLVHDIALNLPLKLTELHAAADALKMIGSTQTHLSGKSSVQHGMENIQTADTALAEQWPVLSLGKIKLVQTKAPTVAEGVHIKDYLAIDYDLDKNKQIKTELNVVTPGILTPPLLAAMPVEIKNQSQLTWPLSKTLTRGNIKIDGMQALNYDLSIDDKPQHLQLKGNIIASETPKWQKYLADLKAAEAVGRLTVKLAPDVHLKHAANTVLELDPEKLDTLSANIILDVEVTQSAALPGSQLVLSKPFTLKQTLDWSTKAVNASSIINIGSIAVPGVISVDNLPGKIQLQAENGLEPEKVDLTVHFDQGQIVLHQTVDDKTESLTLSKLATPLDLQLQAQKIQDTALLQKLLLTIGNGVLQVNASGTATMDGKNAQLEARIDSELSDKLLPERGLSGAGKFTMPIKLTLVDGTQATLESALKFDNYSLMIDKIRLDKLNGSITINEELLLQDKFVGFKYLLQADPFQRVDYDRIQPYLDTENVLSFENMEFNGMKVGPGMTSININQNLLRIPRMDMELFDGHIMGQVFFDATPGAQKFGLLSRISRIDPRYLLPDSSKEKQAQAAPISTRTAITFDINERLMEGQMDVTQISKAQLLQLLELVDPEHKDEQIATVRSALRFAHPQRVSVDMMSGLMNLEVAISALPAPINLRGLPLTPIIQQSAGDIESVLSQLPLKNLQSPQAGQK